MHKKEHEDNLYHLVQTDPIIQLNDQLWCTTHGM